MGNWIITIRGTGPHHSVRVEPVEGNPKPVSQPSADDANVLAAGFVATLKNAGHTIADAGIVCGGADDLNDARADGMNLEDLARGMFDAYNAQGPNPGKTHDGRSVPAWHELGDQVRGKWVAAARHVYDRS